MQNFGELVRAAREKTLQDNLSVSEDMQHLDGVQATAYCRIRSTVGDDFKRTERQRTVLTQIIAKAKSANPAQLASLIGGVFPDVDTSLEMDQLIYLAKNMMDYNLGETKGFPFSKSTDRFGDGIGSAVIPCSLETNVVQLHQELYEDTEYEASDEVKNISDDLIRFTGYGANDGD